MTTQVTATVVGGLLKPDQKLELADETRVNRTIELLAERLEPVEAWRSLKTWIRQRQLHFRNHKGSDWLCGFVARGN